MNTKHTTGASNVNIALSVPTNFEIVAVSVERPEPILVSHSSVVADAHDKHQQSVCPILELGLTLCRPKFSPEIVMGVPPETTVLIGDQLEITGLSNEKIALPVPMIEVTVTPIGWLPATSGKVI